MKTTALPNIDVFLHEYTRDDIIARYLTQTAGAGIAHALQEVYTPLYVRTIRSLMADRPSDHQFRVLEYGCGGGMNLLALLRLFSAEGAPVRSAVGADFSAPMIAAARAEAARHLPAQAGAPVTYVVANNETLAADLARTLGEPRSELDGSFDLVVGVNTFRYAHRLGRQYDTARDIRDLLAPGGFSIMIDMNRRFPLFRSKLRNLLKPVTIETYVPSLEEYAAPFSASGLRILDQRNFCWIPHSAQPALLATCRTLAPLLDACCPDLAMRSLVIARKSP